MKLALACLLVLLSGCVADNNTKQDQAPVTTTGPIINVPPAQVTTEKVDTGEITREIRASNETTQNQLSGLVTASVSKLELNLKELFKLQFDTNMTASAEFKAKLESTVNALNDMKINLSNQMTATAHLEAKLQILNEIKASLEAMVTANANGQVGLSNKIDQKVDSLKATFGNVGHDVNMFPKQAVDVIVNTNETWAYVVGLICTVITTVAGFVAKNARKREAQSNQLLMTVLAKLHPDQTRELNLGHLLPKL
jgi:hypothetical protein